MLFTICQYVLDLWFDLHQHRLTCWLGWTCLASTGSLSLSLTLALTLTLTSQSEPGSLLTLSGTGERNPAGACIRIRSSWAFWAAAEANAPDELPAEGHFRRPSSFRLRFFFWDWDGLHCTLLLFDVDSSDADTDNLIWIMYSVCTVNVWYIIFDLITEMSPLTYSIIDLYDDLMTYNL